MYMFARKRFFSRTPRNERFVNEPEPATLLNRLWKYWFDPNESNRFAPHVYFASQWHTTSERAWCHEDSLGPVDGKHYDVYCFESIWFRKVTDFEVVCHAVVTIAGLSHRNPRLLQSKVVPAENRRDIFKCTTQRCVIHSFRNLRKGPLMFLPYLLAEGL